MFQKPFQNTIAVIGMMTRIVVRPTNGFAMFICSYANNAVIVRIIETDIARCIIIRWVNDDVFLLNCTLGVIIAGNIHK